MSNQQIAPVNPNFFEKYGSASQRTNILGRLLLFNKFGEYVAGQEREEIQAGTQLVVLMPTLTVGFVRWEANRPVESWCGFICEGFVPPRRADLGHTDQTQWECFDDGRAKDPIAFSNQVVLVNPDNAGDVYTFTTSAKGGLGALGELSAAYGKHARLTPYELPVVEIGRGAYQHPQFGQVRFPTFRIVRWVHVEKLPPVFGVPPLPGLVLPTTAAEPNRTKDRGISAGNDA
jgi:hypothetical protein